MTTQSYIHMTMETYIQKHGDGKIVIVQILNIGYDDFGRQILSAWARESTAYSSFEPARASVDSSAAFGASSYRFVWCCTGPSSCAADGLSNGPPNWLYGGASPYVDPYWSSDRSYSGPPRLCRLLPPNRWAR